MVVCGGGFFGLLWWYELILIGVRWLILMVLMVPIMAMGLDILGSDL